MRQITFAWFNERGWNENVTLSQMMIEEGLNFVMEKVEEYISNIDDNENTAKDLLEILADHVSITRDLLVVTNKSDSFFQKYPENR